MPKQDILQYFHIQPKLQLAEAETVQAASSPRETPSFEISPEILIISGVTAGVLLFLFYVVTLHRALHQSLKNTGYIKDLYTATYISDQLREYMILFAELTEASGEQDLLNARTQIFNFLNRISRQICESKDEALAIKLSDAFFAKIEGRFVKMTPIPEGVVYFRTVAELLLASDGHLFGDALVRYIRHEYKMGLKRQTRMIAEPKKPFGWLKKEKFKKPLNNV